MRTPLCKFTMCDDTTLSSPIPEYPTMKITQIANCLSTDLQSHIEPPVIPIINYSGARGTLLVGSSQTWPFLICTYFMWMNPGFYTY